MIIKIGEFIKFYYEKGYSLEEIHVSYKAFAKEDALEAVDMLRGFRVPIIGGDVITSMEGRLKMTRDHWVCSSWEFDDHEEFLETSIKRARDFIVAYNDTPDCKYLFSIVLPFDIDEPPKDD
jgi:hypothetical protein